MTRFGTFENLMIGLMLLAIVGCGFDTTGQGEPGNSGTLKNSATGSSACYAENARYPTDKDDFQNLLYGHRGFLDVYDGYKHLGHDVVYAEGTPMHPIACGTIRFYGPASGYGTLAAVVEHVLRVPMQAENGEGETEGVKTFLSIYGHMRRDGLAWQVGDVISPEDTIGFTQSDALNGDGTEHLHLGIRLQSMEQAQSVDAVWFRGNDTQGVGMYKRNFSDPKGFIPALMKHLGVSEDGAGWSGTYLASHFPIGTLLRDRFSAEFWLVVSDGKVLNVTSYGRLPRSCAVNVDPEVIACNWQTYSDTFSQYLEAKVVKFQGEPQVYQLYPSQSPSRFRIFLSYESFLSWGYKDSDIESYAQEQKSAVLGGLKDEGMVGLMPGALVKGKGQSEVCAANQDGGRLPIFDWELFTSMGYKPECIYEIDPGTLDQVAGQRSEVMTISRVAECLAESNGSMCQPGSTSSCACGNNVAGTKICASDGKSFGACDCSGMNGPGGSAGPGACEDAVNRLCAPNETKFCACVGGSQGAQTCRDDCLGWQICNCPETGNQGMGGSGNGGSSGAGGQAGSGGQGGSASNTLCVPGLQKSCACLGIGMQGVQQCLNDGMSYGECQCPSGAGGTGGSYGTGGAAGQGTGGSGGSVGNVGAGGTGGSNPDCGQYGVLGKTIFIVRVPTADNKIVSVFGWIDYPGWSGTADVPWSGWSWSQPGNGELVFQQGQSFQGTKYIFAPGVSPGPGQDQEAWYCGQDSCPIGTYIVCNGKAEACRLENGLLSGGMVYSPNQSGWQNLACTLK